MTIVDLWPSNTYGNAVCVVRTQCKILYVGNYLNPSFDPFSQVCCFRTGFLRFLCIEDVAHLNCYPFLPILNHLKLLAPSFAARSLSPPPLYKLRPCPSYSGRRGRNNFVRRPNPLSSRPNTAASRSLQLVVQPATHCPVDRQHLGLHHHHHHPCVQPTILSYFISPTCPVLCGGWSAHGALA